MENDEILPDESISQVFQSGTSVFSNFSSHFRLPSSPPPPPPGVQIIGRCKVVVNTPECLTALEPYMQKVNQLPN